MAEVTKVYKEVEYVIRVSDCELQTILAALASAAAKCPDQYRGYNYFELRENLLRGK